MVGARDPDGAARKPWSNSGLARTEEDGAARGAQRGSKKPARSAKSMFMALFRARFQSTP
eukprot:5996658-Pyramimonas_sp.AAC.1